MTDEVILKSGKILYANCNIIGIDDKLGISEGYDGGLPMLPNNPNYEYYKSCNEDYLTKNEALELIDIMIDRWQKLKKEIENV